MWQACAQCGEYSDEQDRQVLPSFYLEVYEIDTQ